MDMPSPRSVPSAASEKGRQSPVRESAGVLLKHMYMKMSFMASTPPVITRSDWPMASSFIAMESAERALAQAASVTQLVPRRSKRLAMRPATTLPRRPGKLDSCQGTYSAEMRSQTARASSSGMPESRRALSHTGRCRRLTMVPSSSWPEVTPRMTLARSRFIFANWPCVASSRTRCATMSARSWAVSVAGTMFGGMPNSIGSKGTLERKAPRLE